MRTTDDHFAELLTSARSGDAAAWRELYHDLAPVVVGYLRAQRLGDPEDVAGEVFLEVVRDLGTFSGDHRNFRSWALAIAHHRLLDTRRREQRQPATPVTHEHLETRAVDDDPESETLASVGVGDLALALRALTDEQRAVLLLRVIGDLSVAEVAQIIGKRPGAVKQLQRRASDAMRQSLDASARSRRAIVSASSTSRSSRTRPASVVSPAIWTTR